MNVQVALPHKPDKIKSSDVKITSVGAMEEFFGKGIPVHSKSEKKVWFNECVDQFQKNVVIPLKALSLKSPFNFYPHILYSRTEIVRKRIACTSGSSEMVSKFENNLSSSQITWGNSLYAAQLKYPLKVPKNPGRNNLSQKKHN